MRWVTILAASALLVACGDTVDGTDGGIDSGRDGADAGRMDGGDDTGGGGDSDGGGDTDGGGDVDGGAMLDAGPRPDGAVACTSDAQCTSGAEWCEGGFCVPCDNSGLLCDIACTPDGWSTYMRNGCAPCECAPPSQCTSDGDCTDAGGRCYPGRFCWCPAGGPPSPDCCMGNFCSMPGCTTPNPAGCRSLGCPRGQACVIAGGTCVASSCFCDGSSGTWGCTEDCGGGSCMSP